MIELDLENLLDEITPPASSYSDVVHGDALAPQLEKKGVLKDDGKRQYMESITLADFLPSSGIHLGLDISKNSTGITVVKNGTYTSWNYTFTLEEGNHKEVLMRRQLYRYLWSEFKGIHFETVIIEDAYSGKNPETVRLLYAINTAIDELILDGYISCDTFIRSNNQSWKSWLWSIEPSIGKGLDDKVRTELLLSHLGVSEGSDSGYQDRLDSLGMLVGYFYKYNVSGVSTNLPTSKVKVSWANVGVAVVPYNLADDSLVLEGYIPKQVISRPLITHYSGNKAITREYIKSLFTTNMNALEYTSSLVVIESEKRDLGLSINLLKVKLKEKELALLSGKEGSRCYRLVVWKKNKVLLQKR